MWERKYINKGGLIQWLHKISQSFVNTQVRNYSSSSSLWTCFVAGNTEALKADITASQPCSRAFSLISFHTWGDADSQVLSNLPHITQLLSRWVLFEFSSSAWEPVLPCLCVCHLCQAPESLRLSCSSSSGLHGVQRPFSPENLSSVMSNTSTLTHSPPTRLHAFIWEILDQSSPMPPLYSKFPCENPKAPHPLPAPYHAISIFHESAPPNHSGGNSSPCLSLVDENNQ